MQGNGMGNSEIAGRILHTLAIYPRVSHSMLQITLNTPANVWRPALEHLIKTGQVLRGTIVATSPAGRVHSYTILQLGDKAPVKVVDVVSNAGEGLNSDGTYAAL